MKNKSRFTGCFGRSGVILTLKKENAYLTSGPVLRPYGAPLRSGLHLTYNGNAAPRHSVRFLYGIWVRLGPGLDPALQPCGTGSSGAPLRSGFTLIELLVVVLIIGILAAVAIPQYHLAVNKSRFANLRAVAQAYAKAAQVYYLANGNYPNNFDELSVDLPAGNTLTTSGNTYGNYTCGTSNDMYCCILPPIKGVQVEGVICSRLDYSFAYFDRHYEDKICVADRRNAQAVQLCKSFGGSFFQKGNLVAPGGHQPGQYWDYYWIN